MTSVGQSGVPRSTGSLLHLNLSGPPTMMENHLMSDETLVNLTTDEAIARINQLMTENAQLKVTIQQTNSSMKMACESFAVLKQKAKKEEEEHLLHYNESKNVVTELRKKISDKDKIIENLRQQIHQDATLLESSDQLKQLQTESGRLMHENQELKAKISMQEVSAEEIKALKLQVANLLTNQDTSKQQFVRETSFLQQRCLTLEKQIPMIRSEEQKKFDKLHSENEKLSAELRTVTMNYEQLMSDYHDLLTSNDQQKTTQDSQVAVLKKDFESRLDNLTAQLVTAEEVLMRKEEHIKTLHQKLNDLEPLQAQVAIYKADFEAERKSREELNDRCLELEEKFRLLERQFVVQGFNPNPPVNPLPLPAPPNPVNPFPVATDPEPDQFKCPLCGHNAPDLDSLQLHVYDCIK